MTTKPPRGGDGLVPDSEDLRGWVQRYVNFVSARKEHEDLADRIKKGPEAEAKENVLRIFADRGEDSVRLSDGLGLVSRTVKKQMRLVDAEAFCEHMFKEMSEARARRPGASLVDHLLTVKQPLKNENLKWAESRLDELGLLNDHEALVENLNKVLAERGLAVTLVEDIIHTKPRR